MSKKIGVLTRAKRWRFQRRSSHLWVSICVWQFDYIMTHDYSLYVLKVVAFPRGKAGKAKHIKHYPTIFGIPWFQILHMFMGLGDLLNQLVYRCLSIRNSHGWLDGVLDDGTSRISKTTRTSEVTIKTPQALYLRLNMAQGICMGDTEDLNVEKPHYNHYTTVLYDNLGHKLGSYDTEY